MPPLNRFDDYEACMRVFKDEAKYCYVRTAIKPNSSSELYNFIWEFSNMKKQHFRHDKLSRGICINKCKELIEALGISAEEFYVPEFNLDYAVSDIWSDAFY